MVVYQKPNPPVLIAFITFVLSFVFSGVLYAIDITIFYFALFTWSLLEIFWGANGFRKFLGVVGFLIGAFFLIFGIR
jgi:hypothetical protein